MKMPFSWWVLSSLPARLREKVYGCWASFRFGRGAEVELLDAIVPAFLSIRNRSGGLQHLLPNRVQQEFASRRTQRNIVLKARQMGITTYVAGRFFLATILRPGTVTLQVAHSLESAQQIFRIVHRFLANLDPDLREKLRVSHANVRELSFAATDSRYIVDTAGNRSAGRGLTIHNLHASEVAQWPGDPAETMAALLAGVSPDGNVEIESTPHGAGGYFHREWVRATQGQGFTPHFFPWWLEEAYCLPLLPGESLAPLTTEEQQLRERHGLSLGQIKYRRHLRATFGGLTPQEFAENDAECFLVSGRPVFELSRIEDRLKEIPRPLATINNGAELVWLHAVPGRAYVIGADVAEGVGAGDYSACVVLDAETGLQCAEMLARWPIARFAQELARLGRTYNQALIAVERNNQGHAVIYALQHSLGYSNLYCHPDGDHERRGKPGWPMNVQTKPLAIGVLEKALRGTPEMFASARLLEQCRSFAYHDNGQAAALPGTHDDLVIAAAIALAVRAQAVGPRLLSMAT